MEPVQLSISKDCLAAMVDLPLKVRKKALDLVDSFRTDSRSAAVHLEPIGSFKDPNARTARVGDDWRAIIIAPQKGNHFVLVHVDHHDEAMRWAQNKRFEIHPVHGALQVLDVEAAQQSVTVPPPSKVSAGLFKDVTHEELVSLGLPAPLIPSVRCVVDVAGFESLKGHLPQEAREPLEWMALGGTLEEAQQYCTAGKAGGVVDTQDFGKALEEPNTLRRFVAVKSSQELEQWLTKDMAAWRIFLHPDQRKLVNWDVSGPVRVLGGPGTGKTVVAMHRAKHLVERVFTGPDDRVLFTTFSKSLAQDISHNLKRLRQGDTSRMEVTHLHSWAVRSLRAVGVTLNIATEEEMVAAWSAAWGVTGLGKFGEGFIKQEWARVIQAQGILDEQAYLRAPRRGRGGPVLRKEDRAFLWTVFQGYRGELDARGRVEWVDVIRRARQHVEASKVSPYCAVVVDEAQDFSPEDLRLVRALAAAGPNDLFLVGDAHQRIYAPQTALSTCGIDIVGRGRKLKVNYRITHQIRSFALNLLGQGVRDDLNGGADDLKGYTSVLTGPAPEWTWFSGEEAAHQAAVDQVRLLLEGDGAQADGIGVLAPQKSVLVKVAAALEAAGIKVVWVDEREDAAEKGGVQLATFHRSKGLEYAHVLVVGLGDARHPRLPAPGLAEDDLALEEHRAHEEALLFVAATRARNTLWMSGYGERQGFSKVPLP